MEKNNNNGGLLSVLEGVDYFVCEATPEACLTTAALIVLNKQNGQPVVLSRDLPLLWEAFASTDGYISEAKICLVGFSRRDSREVASLLKAFRKTGAEVAFVADPFVQGALTKKHKERLASPYVGDEYSAAMTAALLSLMQREGLVSHEKYAAALLRAAGSQSVETGSDFKLLQIMTAAADGLGREISCYIAHLVRKRFSEMGDFWRQEVAVMVASLFSGPRQHCNSGILFDSASCQLTIPELGFSRTGGALLKVAGRILARNGKTSMVVLGETRPSLPAEFSSPVIREAESLRRYGWIPEGEMKSQRWVLLGFVSRPLSKKEKDLVALKLGFNFHQAAECSKVFGGIESLYLLYGESPHASFGVAEATSMLKKVQNLSEIA